jgi:hypothetical protein
MAEYDPAGIADWFARIVTGQSGDMQGAFNIGQGIGSILEEAQAGEGGLTVHDLVVLLNQRVQGIVPDLVVRQVTAELAEPLADVDPVTCVLVAVYEPTFNGLGILPTSTKLIWLTHAAPRVATRRTVAVA